MERGEKVCPQEVYDHEADQVEEASSRADPWSLVGGDGDICQNVDELQTSGANIQIARMVTASVLQAEVGV